MMEHIVSIDGRLSLLFVAKHEVDPMVQSVRHVIRLQGCAVEADELSRVAARPRGQDYVAESHAGLF